MTRAEDCDTVYSLLVALCDHPTCGPTTDLITAFNLFAEMHTPRTLRATDVMSYDRMLGDALAHLQRLSATSTDLAEKARLLTLAVLVASVSYEHGPDAGRSA